MPVALSVGLSPVIAQLFRGQRSDITMEQMVSLGVRLVMVVALGVVVAANVFAGEIMSLFPAEYATDAYVLRIYSVISALVFMVVATDQYLLAAGRRRQVLYGALFNLGIAIALEIPLVTWYGVRGMMAAKAVALLATIAYQLSVARRDMRVGALNGLARMIAPTLVGALCLALTWTAPLAVRASISLVATAASVFLFGTLHRQELGQLRRLRLS